MRGELGGVLHILRCLKMKPNYSEVSKIYRTSSLARRLSRLLRRSGSWFTMTGIDMGLASRRRSI